MINRNFKPFPDLASEKLILRALDMGDKREIFLLRSDDRVNEFLLRQKAASEEDAVKFIQTIIDAVDKGESILWAITLKQDLRFAGTICLWNFSPEKSAAEIGYELLPDFQGRGIMQEALPKIIEYGFSCMNLQTMTGELGAGNIKSAALLERNKFVRNPVPQTDDSGEQMIEYVLWRS